VDEPLSVLETVGDGGGGGGGTSKEWFMDVKTKFLVD